MNQQKIGANPVGMIGKLVGRIMNLMHNKQYKTIVMKINKTEDDKLTNIIDVGCGGGIAIKHLSDVFNKAQIYGIDISPDMVKLAAKLNRKAISEGRVKVFKSNVENINISSNTINIVTIFDNINFWINYVDAFSEIKRILRKDGRIYIINGYPEIGSKWHNFVKFKDIDEYRKLLEDNGFLLVNHELEGHTIILEGVLC